MSPGRNRGFHLNEEEVLARGRCPDGRSQVGCVLQSGVPVRRQSCLELSDCLLNQFLG